MEHLYNDLSNAQVRLIAEAYDEALKANEMGFRHGCCAVKNGSIVAKGHNHPRTTIRGTAVCTFHAEIDTLSQLLRGRKDRYF